VEKPGNAGGYGFGGRLTPVFPSQIIVDITEVCNLACVHCPHPEFAKTSFYGARYLPVELNTKMVDEVREHGQGHMKFIRYTSEGEPLIHPQAYDMIEDSARRSGVFVTLTTNGTIMNEKRTQRLLDAAVHMIDISIDAFTPEVYSRIRVNGDLEVTRGNVQRLLRWVDESGHKTKVIVSYIEQPENRHETEDFRRFWQDQGADYVVVRRLHSAAGAVTNVAKAMHRENQGVARRPCVYPWERVVLNPRGFLAFCPADWTDGSKVFDFRETTIRETWQGEFYAHLRQAHLNNDFTKHEFCGQCPDWAAIRWPHEGRSYADLVEEFLEPNVAAETSDA
jgi:MoaA/NifB/PqqE/SkfB family radical SAM enzyme